MIVDWISLQVVAVLFIATLIRSTFGFGEALVAVPLLAFLMPIEVAAPVAALVSITVAGLIIAQDWQHVHFRSAGWLFLWTLLGTPLGLLLLTVVATPIVKAILGFVIVAFSTYSLIGRRKVVFQDDRLTWIFGFAAGVLGGAYAMNGPPLVIYGALRGWSPQRFRATLQGYFLPASMAGLAGFWLAGLWVPAVTRYYFLALPAVLVAIFLGRAISQRISGRSFLLSIHVGLIVAGVTLLLQSLISFDSR